jgi:hypothetical protein
MNAPSPKEQELKAAFALAWLRTPGDPFKAAQTVFGADIGTALRVSHEWVNDPYVKDVQRQALDEHGEQEFLPSKFAFAHSILTMSEGVRDSDVKAKYLRLFGEIMGYIEKPGVVVNNNVDNRRVMIVKDHGGDDDWEARLVNQQRTLIHAAQTKPN